MADIEFARCWDCGRVRMVHRDALAKRLNCRCGSIRIRHYSDFSHWEKVRVAVRYAREVARLSGIWHPLLPLLSFFVGLRWAWEESRPIPIEVKPVDTDEPATQPIFRIVEERSGKEGLYE